MKTLIFLLVFSLPIHADPPAPNGVGGQDVSTMTRGEIQAAVDREYGKEPKPESDSKSEKQSPPAFAECIKPAPAKKKEVAHDASPQPKKEERAVSQEHGEEGGIIFTVIRNSYMYVCPALRPDQLEWLSFICKTPYAPPPPTATAPPVACKVT